MAQRPLSILTIGGHPKDAIIYTGGTMANHVEAGDRVCTLTPTHGLSHHLRAIAEYSRTGKMPNIDSLIEELRQELVEAAAELGVTDVRFLGHDDSVPMIERVVIEDIADVIGDVRPDIVVTHNPNDSVPGHAVATQMTLLAIEAASGIRPGKDFLPHTPKQIFFHAQAGRTNVQENDVPRVPTTIIDITDVIHKKANAMNKFTSQYYGEDSPLHRKLSEVSDGVHGLHARVPYAEAFVAHNPETYKTLPHNDYTARLEEQPGGDPFAHMTQMLLDSYKPRA